MEYWFGECCLCGRTLTTNNPRLFCCSECYETYQEDILAKAEWIQYCVSWEAQRRRYGTYTENGETKRVEFIYGLGDTVDILDGQLIPLREASKDE